MTRKTPIQPRKRPRQVRSQQTNEAILRAAARVLKEEGPAAFNTNRVAEVAGVSVGSLYQYYPNKAALLFQLDVLDSSVTWSAIEAILADARRPAGQRIAAAIQCFFESEASEVELRGALRKAEALFEHTPQIEARNGFVRGRVRDFLAGILPARSPDLDFKAELFTITVSSIAEKVTDRTTDASELRRWSKATSEMLCAQLGIE